LRHLRHRALLTVGEKVRSMHDVVMPIIVLAEQSREEATVEWGLLGAKKSQLNDTYHVQESASTEMGTLKNVQSCRSQCFGYTTFTIIVVIIIILLFYSSFLFEWPSL